jgi:hypothetical protein
VLCDQSHFTTYFTRRRAPGQPHTSATHRCLCRTHCANHSLVIENDIACHLCPSADKACLAPAVGSLV